MMLGTPLLVLIAITSVNCLPDLLMRSGVKRHAVSLDISPNHESALWARDTGKDVQCPASVKAVLEHNKRAVTLSLQLNDEREHAVPVTLNDGVSTTTHHAPATGCIYRDDESQADVVLRPKQRGMHVSGRFMTPDGVYGLETDSNLQHFAYQIATENAAQELTQLAVEKRDIEKRYASKYVELYMIVGYSLYKTFADINGNNEENAIDDIKYYATQLVLEMNYIYGISGTDIEIFLQKIQIQKDEASDCLRKHKMGMKNWENYREGVKGYEAFYHCSDYATKELPKADHYMFLTTDDMYSSSASYRLKGLCWIGQVCKQNSTAVLETYGVHYTAYIAAHELGHGLGSQHDPKRGQCSSSNSYVMSSKAGRRSSSFLRNSMQFSSCSISQMRSKISDTTCLNNKPSTGKYKKYEELKQLSLDEQCKIATASDNSRFCGSQARLGEICSDLPCTHPRTGKCESRMTANQNTTCGNKMWCWRYECVRDDNAPTLADCVYGDGQDKVDGMTCKQLVNSRPTQCYDSWVYSKCCESCTKAAKNNPSWCRWGDSSNDCRVNSAAQCYDRKEECCKTCQKLETGNKDCLYGDRDDRCDSNKIGFCAEESYHKRCCGTCAKHRSGDETCPYGDHPDRCKNIHPSDCNNPSKQKECCASCKKFREGNPATCPYGDAKNCKSMWAGECYVASRAKECCAKCPQFRTSEPGCMYGDHAKSCEDMSPADCADAPTAANCCAFCKKHKTNNPNCPFGDSEKSCKRINPNRCASERVRERCCGTCERVSTGDPTCPYGEPERDCRDVTKHACKADDSLCCQSCKKLRTNIPGCEYGDTNSQYCTMYKGHPKFCVSKKDYCCETCHNMKK